MFMGKELHYPTPMLYCPPPTYNSHPCYLKLRGGTKRNETNELTDRTHPRFVSFIVLDVPAVTKDGEGSEGWRLLVRRVGCVSYQDDNQLNKFCIDECFIYPEFVHC